MQFAREIEEAGADGLEVNIFVMPSDPSKSSAENEKVYFDVLNAVTRAVRIPVAAKVSSYFSALAHTAEALPSTGIGSLVMFNRFFFA